MPLGIAVCDDLPEHSAHLRTLLEADACSQDASIVVFGSSSELLAALEAQAAYDIFFLDVELGADSGIRLAQRINRMLPASQIVFVTANIVNAVDIDEAQHVYFLTKPVNPQKLHSALLRAMEPLTFSTDKRLKLPLAGGSEAVLSSGQVVYCERVKRITSIICADGTLLQTPYKLDALEAELPARMFSRPHTSYLLNLMYVGRLERYCVHMSNGLVLPVSNQRRNGFRDALSAFVSHLS